MVACQFSDNSGKPLILNNYSPTHRKLSQRTSLSAKKSRSPTLACGRKKYFAPLPLTVPKDRLLVLYIEQFAFELLCRMFSCFVPTLKFSLLAPAGKRVLIQHGQAYENNILTLIHDLFTVKKTL
jgi:hypothetical protein